MEPKTLKVSLSSALSNSCLLGGSFFSCPWTTERLPPANKASPQNRAGRLAFAIFILPLLSSALIVKDHLSSKPQLLIRGDDLAHETNQARYSISPQDHIGFDRFIRQRGVNRQPHCAERRPR